MNKRLVWNFEISKNNPLSWSTLQDEKDEIRWEARYFWPEDTIITLEGLDDDFLALSNYEIKHRQDRYSLFENSNYNIKKRHLEWLYKPLLKEEGTLRGYGKKINLADYPPDKPLTGTKTDYAPALLAQLEKNQQEIDIEKEVLIFKFATKPKIKMELARLDLAKKIYFSLSIEGRSQSLVSTIASRLLGEQVSCDYVNFLKQTLKP